MADQTKLDRTLDHYMSVTSKSKVAVIIPLYGYWKDASTEQLTKETLKLCIDRITSSIHQVYIIFVGEMKRISDDVGNVVAGHCTAGNARFVRVPEGSNYADFIRAGFDALKDGIDAQFVVNINPWLVFQYDGIDIIIDRINRDDAKIVSGFDLRGLVEPNQFNTYHANIPKEERDLCINMFGLKTAMIDLLQLDPKYTTHYFIGRDMWQRMYTQGFEVITSQKIPIFTFKVDWDGLDTVGDFEVDKAYFISKWGFDPGIKYE